MKKKLSFNKKTIARLTAQQQIGVKGGQRPTYHCNSIPKSYCCTSAYTIC